MEVFILSVQLWAGGPVETWRVSDCQKGVEWIREAWKWTERVGVSPLAGPMYVCYRAKGPEERL